MRSYWFRSIFADCAAPGAFLRFRARPLTFLPGVVADLAAPVRECYLWMLSAGQNERPQSGHTRTHQERAIVAALVFLDTARAGKGQRRGAPAAKSIGTTAKRGRLWKRTGGCSMEPRTAEGHAPIARRTEGGQRRGRGPRSRRHVEDCPVRVRSLPISRRYLPRSLWSALLRRFACLVCIRLLALTIGLSVP
jgi:hypothetical protein